MKQLQIMIVRQIIKELESIDKCLRDLSNTNEAESQLRISELAAEHISEHDVILVFGKDLLFKKILEETKEIDYSLIFVQESHSGGFK